MATLQEIKLKAVKAAIRRYEGNKRCAACELGVSLKTIYNILERDRVATKAEKSKSRCDDYPPTPEIP